MTNKKLFISQGTLELGRNRNERKLNAILDNNPNQQQVVLNNILNPFSSVDTGEDMVSVNSDSSFQTSPVCIHYPYCKSPHKFMIKCNYPIDCNIKKFYDRYKDNLNFLGIGSRV